MIANMRSGPHKLFVENKNLKISLFSLEIAREIEQKGEKLKNQIEKTKNFLPILISDEHDLWEPKLN